MSDEEIEEWIRDAIVHGYWSLSLYPSVVLRVYTKDGIIKCIRNAKIR